jgi:peptide deformylase
MNEVIDIKEIEKPIGDVWELVDGNSSILKQKLPLFNFSNPPTDPIQLAWDLAATMKAFNGLGLSANQIGMDHRVFVMQTSPVLVCFNPIIVDASNEIIILEEGCLSYPNLFINIRRPSGVKLRFTQPNGNVETMKFNGITARVVFHELDHLDGILFYSKAALSERKRAFNKMKILNRRKK